MNIWLHRISHHAELSYPLLERGYLSIGFSDFSNEDFIEKTQNRGWDYFEQSITETWGIHPPPRTRYNLWRFVAEMEIGDWVLVPSWGVFSIYEIIGDVEPVGNAAIDDLKTWNGETVSRENGLLVVKETAADLGLVRKVKPIDVNLSRYDYADAALTSRMKIRTTNANITDLEENIKKALEAFRENRPINLHSKILASSRAQVLKLIQEDLIPNKFESLIKWYFEQVGASDVWIPAKNEAGKEGDADVVAVFEALKTTYYIQAKHHKRITSEWATQQIRDYCDQQNAADDGYARIAWVVTSGDAFSDESMKLAKKHSISLFTGHDLARMILEAGIENLDKAF